MDMIDQNVNLLVVSAHAADFVWRAGGTIAKYVKHGANVHLVILSYGIRGESNDLWNIEGQTYENVKKVRISVFNEAVKCLGVKNVEMWDFEDYHMQITEERMDRLTRKIREVRPHHIISHGPKDAFNPDHETVSKYVFEASVLSTSNGVRIEGYPTAKQARIFGFEPHQSEISDFKPDVIIDITEVYEQKEAAMNCFKAQQHLIDYYGAKAKLRGNHARRCSGNNQYKYAEAFSRFFPYVGGELV
jgi:4-oxalomesaconate hydratase